MPHSKLRCGGTLLYDAIYLASDELMSKQHGRKALIVLSDGVDRGSRESLASAIETAQKANTMVYSIYFKGEESQQGSGHRGFGGRVGGGIGGGGIGGGGMGGGGMGRRGGGYPRPQPQEQRPDGKKVLEQISKETGSRLFEASKKETVAQIYSQIEEDLRNQYSLGFSRHKEGAQARYHKITLQAKKKDLTVQARDGYYGAE